MYKQITKLDSLTCPLQGRVVIEAAAGTGKTYNIQNLVARLLLEKGYAIDEIVVVTFTNAATAELKMRIRKILTDLAAVLEGKSNTEAQAKALVEAIRKQQVPVTDDIMLKRVRSALRDFDLAAISTIDGFVQRINSEFAVENGVRFAVTPVENNEEKIGEAFTTAANVTHSRNHGRRIYIPSSAPKAGATKKCWQKSPENATKTRH